MPFRGKQINLVAKLMNTRLQNQNFTIFKIALNRVLTLPDYSTGLALLISCGIIDFVNKNISVVRKHWNYRISVPMSYITFLHWPINLQNVQKYKNVKMHKSQIFRSLTSIQTLLLLTFVYFWSRIVALQGQKPINVVT